MTYTEMVREFHACNGAVIDGHNNGSDVAALRIGLIIEEFSETIEAMRENNVIEVADGITDLLYVIAGTAVSYGVMSTCELPLRPITLPPANFKPDDVYKFINRVLSLITNLAGVLNLPSLIIADAINRLWNDVAWAAASIWGLPVDELFNEVHRSNMTKTFAPASNLPGGKYGAVNPKGPGYSPPDILGVLNKAKMTSLPCIAAPQSHP